MKIEHWDKLTTAIDDLRGIAKETGIIDLTDIEIEVGFGSWDGEGIYGVIYTSDGDQPADLVNAEYERIKAQWEASYPEIANEIIIERDYSREPIIGGQQVADPTWIDIPTSTQITFTISGEDC